MLRLLELCLRVRIVSRRGAVLAVWALLAGALLCLPAASGAATVRSHDVAVVLGEGASSGGVIPTSGSVAGIPEDSFEEFSFAEMPQEELDAERLSQFDTVLLDQVYTSSLTPTQQQALSSFVTGGGKLIIHDADGTEGNDYSWLPVPAHSGHSCLNCGNLGGVAEIVESNTLASAEPSSPYYIDTAELPGNSDAVGDANVLMTQDPRWDVTMRATNPENVEGIADAYAQDGGLIIYNGLDTDALEAAFPVGVNWSQKMLYQELAQQWNPDNLPHSTPATGSGRCGQAALRVGVVSVCAEHISGSGAETVASGDVVLDGGVSVGEGPLDINQESKVLSSSAAVPISVLRPGAALALGSASVSIDASGATDPISGKSGLAKLSLTGAQLGALKTLSVGGLQLSMPEAGNINMYLDAEMGGGVMGAASVNLSVLSKRLPSGSLSVGVYAGSNSPTVVVGGTASFPEIDFGNGWKFDGLQLSYQQPTDSWTASGGLEVPLGSLEAAGSLTGGRLDSLGVTIGGLAVPVGDSGFFLSHFTGGVSGLATGPLQVIAGTGGFWGVPKAPVEPFYLDDVRVTISFAGSVRLDGRVSFITESGSPLTGDIHLELGLAPFHAIGSASVNGKLPGVSLSAGGGAGFTTRHFTVALNGSLSVFGLKGSGHGIVSDAGMGAEGNLCTPSFLGAKICESLAFAGTWSQYGKFDLPALLGGEPRSLITVGGVASVARPLLVRVPRGRTLLVIALHGEREAPSARLRAPRGRLYRRSAKTVLFTREPQFGLTIITVIHPRPGVWRVEPAGGAGAVRAKAETVRRVGRLRARASGPHGSRRHPLSARARVLLSWSAIDMPRGLSVTVVRSGRPHQRGGSVVLARSLPASGRYRLRATQLAVGPNYLTLVVSFHGVPFQEISLGAPVWRKPPVHKRSRSHHVPAHRKHSPKTHRKHSPNAHRKRSRKARRRHRRA